MGQVKNLDADVLCASLDSQNEVTGSQPHSILWSCGTVTELTQEATESYWPAVSLTHRKALLPSFPQACPARNPLTQSLGAVSLA